MKAKEYLLQYRNLEERKLMLIDMLKSVDEEAISIGGVNYGDKVQSSPQNDPIGNIVIDLIKRKSELGLMLTEVRAKQLVIENLLATVSDTMPKYYRILVYKYIMNNSWKKICREMGMSRSAANKLHDNALNYFQKKVLNR